MEIDNKPKEVLVDISQELVQEAIHCSKTGDKEEMKVLIQHMADVFLAAARNNPEKINRVYGEFYRAFQGIGIEEKMRSSMRRKVVRTCILDALPPEPKRKSPVKSKMLARELRVRVSRFVSKPESDTLSKIGHTTHQLLLSDRDFFREISEILKGLEAVSKDLPAMILEDVLYLAIEPEAGPDKQKEGIISKVRTGITATVFLGTTLFEVGVSKLTGKKRQVSV